MNAPDDAAPFTAASSMASQTSSQNFGRLFIQGAWSRKERNNVGGWWGGPKRARSLQWNCFLNKWVRDAKPMEMKKREQGSMNKKLDHHKFKILYSLLRCVLLRVLIVLRVGMKWVNQDSTRLDSLVHGSRYGISLLSGFLSPSYSRVLVVGTTT